MPTFDLIQTEIADILICCGRCMKDDERAAMGTYLTEPGSIERVWIKSLQSYLV